MNARPALHRIVRATAAAGAALALAGAAGAAHARGGFSVGIDIGWPVFGAVLGSPYYPYGNPYAYGSVYSSLPSAAVSVSVGGGRYWHHNGVWFRPWGPRWVVVAPPVGVVVPLTPAPEAVPPPPPVPAAPPKPEPVIYPRNGQDANQTEYDRRECNRWATTQPAALADAEVFQRAVAACMDGRGYSVK